MGHIICSGCSFYYTVDGKLEDAFKHWNTRATGEVVEALEKVREKIDNDGECYCNEKGCGYVKYALDILDTAIKEAREGE